MATETKIYYGTFEHFLSFDSFVCMSQLLYIIGLPHDTGTHLKNLLSRVLKQS